MLHDSCYKGQKEKTTAKEFTCSYVKLYSIDPSTQPLLVFIELGYIDKTEGKLLSTNEYGGLEKRHLQWPLYSAFVTFSFSCPVTNKRQSQ